MSYISINKKFSSCGNDYPWMKVIVHGGEFHADEVSCIAMLAIVFPEFELRVERRDPTPEELADPTVFVLDVGGKLEPELNNYDHHSIDSRNSEGRERSAFGLLVDLCNEVATSKRIEPIRQEFIRQFVSEIDAVDTGAKFPTVMEYSSLINNFNPPISEGEVNDSRIGDYEFLAAVQIAEQVIAHLIMVLQVQSDISRIVNAGTFIAHEQPDANILVIDQDINIDLAWSAIFQLPQIKHLKYIVYPSSRGGWHVQNVRSSVNTFDSNYPLPKPWWGLRGDDFVKVTGIAGAEFCHRAGFVCGGKTAEDAIKLAQQAVYLYLQENR